MAWRNFVLEKGYDAAAAMTKYRLVKFSAAEKVTPITAITDIPAGVGQYTLGAAEIAQGKGQSVMVLGISEVEVTGAIAVGVRCQLEADGRVSAEVGASGKRLVGFCFGTPSASAGDRISMLIVHGMGLA